MKARLIVPGLSLLLWCCFAVIRPQNLSNPEQVRYYFVIPLLMASISMVLVMLLLMEVVAARVGAQVLAVFVLLALLPYVFFYTGGM